MKTKILLFVIFCLPIIVWGQINRTVRDTLLKVEVTAPVFTGLQFVLDEPYSKDDILGKYLAENFVYPAVAYQYGMQGTGVVQFVVQPNGKLTDFHVMNSICSELDKEFIRVLKTTEGMWSPGSNNDNPVQMEKEVSMMFVADCDWCNNKPKEYFTKLAKMHFTKANNLFLVKKNLKKALINYDKTIKYLPYDASVLLVRGLCKYEIGDLEGARTDWERINRLGSFDANWYIDELATLKGYDEMMATIEK